LVVGPTAVPDGSVSWGELVSRGRMADVYEAHGRLVGRSVAIEVFAPAFGRDGGFVERFRRTARAAAHLNQPDIVAAFEGASHDVPDSRRRGFA
jgi:serine/threonine protein kinase